MIVGLRAIRVIYDGTPYTFWLPMNILPNFLSRMVERNVTLSEAFSEALQDWTNKEEADHGNPSTS